MPYKSDAQRRFFNAAGARGDIPMKTVNEFNKASKGMSLPETVKKKKMAHGGMVDDPSRFDYSPHEDYEGMGEWSAYDGNEDKLDLYHGGEVGDPSLYVPEREDSSGEPHEEDKYDESEPMEYMFAGGTAGEGHAAPEMKEAKKILMSHGMASEHETNMQAPDMDDRMRKPLPHFAKGGMFVKALKMRGYR